MDYRNMFWKKKSKKTKKSRGELIQKAKETVTAKREEIGDETLDRIRAAMAKNEISKTAEAKKKILNADQDKVRDHLSYMMRDKDD